MVEIFREDELPVTLVIDVDSLDELSVLSKSRQPEVRDSWVLWFRPMCITRIWRYRRARRRPNRPIAQRRR